VVTSTKNGRTAMLGTECSAEDAALHPLRRLNEPIVVDHAVGGHEYGAARDLSWAEWDRCSIGRSWRRETRELAEKHSHSAGCRERSAR